MSSSCPQCCSKAFKRNGYTRHGKQNHRCLDCGRQFSLEPTDQIHEEDALLLNELINETSTCDAYSFVCASEVS